MPFVRAIVPDGGRAPAAGSCVTPPDGLFDSDRLRRSEVRVDVVTIFPEYLAPLEAVADRPGPGGRPARVARPRPARLDPRRPPHRRRHPVRRRPRHGDAPRAVGRGARRAGARRGAHLVVPTPGRRAVHPGDGRTSWPRPTPGVRLRPVRGHRPARRRHAAARMRVREVSIGDYVLFGGEVAVLVIVEAVTRLLPGVLGNADSLVEESHARRPAGGARCTPSRRLARAGRARRAALGRPRPDRPLAPRRGTAAHRAAPARPARRARPGRLDTTDRAALVGADFRYRTGMWQSSGVAARGCASQIAAMSIYGRDRHVGALPVSDEDPR